MVVRRRLFSATSVIAVAAIAAAAAFMAVTTSSTARSSTVAASDASYLTVGATGVSRHTAAPIDTQALAGRSALTPQYQCSALTQQDFSQVKGAPATILSATLQTATSATGTSYQYCDVSGIVDPQVQFELQLPTQTYTGRYLQEGCGGYCGHAGVGQPAASGQAGINECVPLNNGEFALGQDDEGHIGGGNTEAWAINDPVLKVDFGYLSEHVFALAAKAIIGSFYGQRPNLHEFAPDGILGELRRLNYDTANATSEPAIAALLKLVPASKVTYGTDYPYFGLDQMKNLEQLGLSPADLKAIGSENAVGLVPRLQA